MNADPDNRTLNVINSVFQPSFGGSHISHLAKTVMWLFQNVHNSVGKIHTSFRNKSNPLLATSYFISIFLLFYSYSVFTTD